MNEEITNKNPTNKYGKSITGTTTNPSPVEAKLDAAMKGQHQDSLVSDIPFKQSGTVHKDATSATPKGHSEPGTEKPIFTGSMHDGDSSKTKKTEDYTKG